MNNTAKNKAANKASKIPNVLSIAGSDPSGGAGIQADLKTFGALGAYGMCVLAALTAQNTRGVTGIYEVPSDFVRAQLEAIFDDVRVDAVKIGMLGSPETILGIADILKTRGAKNIVLDPVMVSQSGHRLVSREAIEALKEQLIPLADVITPNIPEAEILLGAAIAEDLDGAAAALQDKFGVNVLLKGGHLKGQTARDVLVLKDGAQHAYETPWLDTVNNHGTGCTLSSALAVFLARGQNLQEAAALAKDYLTDALADSEALDVGSGAGPVNHFFAR